MSSPDNPWKLSQRDNEEIFKGIAERAMEAVRRPEHPRVIFIGGQAASSKTTGQRSALARLGEDGGIIADFDALLTEHPHYAEMLRINDQTASQLAGADAYIWMQDLIELAKDERVNLIREGHMGGSSPEREALAFRARGFGTEADVMAVPEAVSRLANLHRYQEMREQSQHGRVVDVSIHDKAYLGIPNTLEAIDQRKFMDAVRLHKWGGGMVYENSLDANGEWRHAGRARAALEAERLRPLSPEHAQWFRERYAHLDRSLPPELRAQLPDIARMGERVHVTVQTSASVEAQAAVRTSTQQQTGPQQRTPAPQNQAIKAVAGMKSGKGNANVQRPTAPGNTVAQSRPGAAPRATPPRPPNQSGGPSR